MLPDLPGGVRGFRAGGHARFPPWRCRPWRKAPAFGAGVDSMMCAWGNRGPREPAGASSVCTAVSAWARSASKPAGCPGSPRPGRDWTAAPAWSDSPTPPPAPRATGAVWGALPPPPARPRPDDPFAGRVGAVSGPGRRAGGLALQRERRAHAGGPPDVLRVRSRRPDAPGFCTPLAGRYSDQAQTQATGCLKAGWRTTKRQHRKERAAKMRGVCCLTVRRPLEAE